MADLMIISFERDIAGKIRVTGSCYAAFGILAQKAVGNFSCTIGYVVTNLN
jgi:hypothetical protein